jgi:translation initiation factor eIF-2B subunit delta
MFRELESILLNRDKGAGELLLLAAEWLVAHPEATTGASRPETCRMLRETRPAMSGFARLADSLQQGESAADLTTRIRGADDAIARRFGERIAATGPVKVVTLSWSSMVFRALSANRQWIEELHVLRSEPGGEGAVSAERAGEAGLRTMLHADNAMAAAVASSHIGVLGADTVFADGAILNKVLSLALARALGAEGKPLYVLASSWKHSPQRSADYEPDDRDRPLLELVPGELITLRISESD